MLHSRQYGVCVCVYMLKSNAVNKNTIIMIYSIYGWCTSRPIFLSPSAKSSDKRERASEVANQIVLQPLARRRRYWFSDPAQYTTRHTDNIYSLTPLMFSPYFVCCARLRQNGIQCTENIKNNTFYLRYCLLDHFGVVEVYGQILYFYLQ